MVSMLGQLLGPPWGGVAVARPAEGSGNRTERRAGVNPGWGSPRSEVRGSVASARAAQQAWRMPASN
eukprot:3763549-Heterocapsa_arctica.AAC.1